MELSPKLVAQFLVSAFLGYLFLGPILVFIFILTFSLRLAVTLLLIPTKYRLIKPSENVCVASESCLFFLNANPSSQNSFTTKEAVTPIFSKLAKYSRLRSTVTTKFGYVVFRDDSATFNISNHIRILTPPNKIVTETEFLQEIVPSLSELIDDSSRPQWEIVVLPKVTFSSETKPRSVFILRFNHCYMDAASASVLLAENMLNWGKDEKKCAPEFFTDPRIPPPIHYKLIYNLQMVKTFLLYPCLLMNLALFSKREEGTDPCYDTASNGEQHFAISKPVSGSSLNNIRAKLKIKTSSAHILAHIIRAGIGKVKGTGAQQLLHITVPLAYLPYQSGTISNQVIATLATLKLEKTHTSPIKEDDLSDIKIEIDYFFYSTVLWVLQLPICIPKAIYSIGSKKAGGGSICLNYLPFTRSKGMVKDSQVDSIGGWGTLFKPCGINISVIRYGDSFRIFAFASGNVLSRHKLDELLDFCVQMLDLSSTEKKIL